MPISVRCPHCQQTFQLRDELAGRTVRCECGRPLPVPDPSTNTSLSSLLDDELARPYDPPPERETPEKPPTKYQPIPPPGYTPLPTQGSAPDAHRPKWQPKPKTQDDGDGGGGYEFNGLGLLLFILVFVVGNIILYYTTGWFIIPLRFGR